MWKLREAVYEQINGNMENEYISAIKKAVQHSMKNHCLVSMNVKVLPPRSIPRSEGKAIRVIDRRNEEVIAL